jgi:hypothetical protein
MLAIITQTEFMNGIWVQAYKSNWFQLGETSAPHANE